MYVFYKNLVVFLNDVWYNKKKYALHSAWRVTGGYFNG